jgi:hypothetical protein
MWPKIEEFIFFSATFFKVVYIWSLWHVIEYIDGKMVTTVKQINICIILHSYFFVIAKKTCLTKIPNRILSTMFSCYTSDLQIGPYYIPATLFCLLYWFLRIYFYIIHKNIKTVCINGYHTDFLRVLCIINKLADGKFFLSCYCFFFCVWFSCIIKS